VWRWVVAPDAPPGAATVLVMSISPDGERGDTATGEFRVADERGCA
jgi:hypothetical protein